MRKILKVCGDLVAVMNAGKIEQYGTPDDVRRSPKTSFVKDFIEARALA